jgi:nicotinate-nucleotide adenylyltransferase
MINIQKKKVGFYGGTFDPIHLGHINLALEILEKHNLDEVWFCPANVSPHRQRADHTTAEHRLNMVKLAISDIPQFKLIDIECKRGGVSYTIDTLKQLIEKHGKTDQFYLILGDDSLKGFMQWKDPQAIVDLVPILIGRRSEGSIQWDIFPPKILQALKDGFTPTRLMAISGTDLRDRLQKGLYCGHLVPSKVMDYIYQNHLY